MYFSWLRTNQPVWYQHRGLDVGAACVLPLLGLVLGVTQWRRTQPFRLSAVRAVRRLDALALRHRRGLRRVRPHVGVQRPALDGALRVDQRERARSGRRRVHRRSDRAVAVPRRRRRHVGRDRRRPADEGSRSRAHPGPGVLRRAPRHARRGSCRPSGCTSRTTSPDAPNGIGCSWPPARCACASEPFSVDSLMARLDAALPGETVVERTLLTEYDNYYYSRGGQTPLPVLRVKFADAAQTWIYVDPEMSRVLGSVPEARARGALALQRPAQPRFRVLVLAPSAVGHRHDRAARSAAWPRAPSEPSWAAGASCAPRARRWPRCRHPRRPRSISTERSGTVAGGLRPPVRFTTAARSAGAELHQPQQRAAAPPVVEVDRRRPRDVGEEALLRAAPPARRSRIASAFSSSSRREREFRFGEPMMLHWPSMIATLRVDERRAGTRRSSRPLPAAFRRNSGR